MIFYFHLTDILFSLFCIKVQLCQVFAYYCKNIGMCSTSHVSFQVNTNTVSVRRQTVFEKHFEEMADTLTKVLTERSRVFQDSSGLLYLMSSMYSIYLESHAVYSCLSASWFSQP